VTPEVERFLQNADDHLDRGQTMLSACLTTTRAGLLIWLHFMPRTRSSLSAQARCSRAIKGEH
jgi:hypothetical protein